MHSIRVEGMSSETANTTKSNQIPLYRELKVAGKEIRLLRIHGLRAGLVECTIEYASLDGSKDSQYRAISWCWGDLAKSGTVLLNGHFVDVPANAEKLLRWLSRHSRGQTIWLDALCIDQNNIEERNSQVRIMRDIYSRATKVLISVNLEADSGVSQAAVQAITAIATQAREVTNDLEDLEAHVSIGIGSSKQRRYTEEPLPPTVDWRAIEGFFASSWFTRVWVIQEAVLAREAICYHGESSIAWKDVALAARWMNHRSYWHYMKRGPATIGIDNTAIVRERADTANNDLYFVLSASRCFRSSDPRDKVFGLLGLVEKVKRPDLQVLADYNRSFREVYVEATKNVIIERQDLIFMTTANSLDPPPGVPESPLDWPSWVPRMDFEFIRAGNSFRPTRLGPKNKADAGLGLRLDENAVPETLRVQGLIVDTVAQVSKPFSEKLFGHSKALTQELALVWNLTVAALGDEVSHSDASKLLADTLTTGPISEYETSAGKISRHDQFNALLRLLGLFPETVGHSSDRESDSEASQAYIYDVWLHSINRRFFITTGGALGMGPRGTLVGDKVCVIFGSKVPLVLRQSGLGWRFVGDTYLHGTMEVRTSSGRNISNAANVSSSRASTCTNSRSRVDSKKLRSCSTSADLVPANSARCSSHGRRGLHIHYQL